MLHVSPHFLAITGLVLDGTGAATLAYGSRPGARRSGYLALIFGFVLQLFDHIIP